MQLLQKKKKKNAFVTESLLVKIKRVFDSAAAATAQKVLLRSTAVRHRDYYC